MEYFLYRYKQQLADRVSEILRIDRAKVTITAAADGVDADLAMACFPFASELRQAPEAIARKLAGELTDESYEASALSGYLNIKFKPQALAAAFTKDIAEHPDYGQTAEGQGRKVIVDFIGLNLSKPFSVGHLRPAVQGWALIQIYKALGFEVIGDSHMGDWGTPFGMWVVGFEKWGSEDALIKEGVYELGRLYVRFREAAKLDETLIDEAKSWLKKLEAGDEQAKAYHERFNAISLKHADEVLDRLKIKADENFGESFYVNKAQNLVDESIEKGIAVQQDDGSVIVRLDEFGIETPALLRKADGSALYLTSDLETIRYRLERWAPAKIIYSVGGEQQFHFHQVFAVAKKLGYDQQTEMTHAWFGTIDEIDDNGQRRKMSSRKNTALLENLLNKAEAKARQITKNQTLSDPHIQAIAVGAIKFNDFAQPRKTNILFDWDSMFSLQGRSSVYIQYAAVRINSILGELDDNSGGPDLDYDWQAEKKLLLQLMNYPEKVQAAAASFEPYLIADYLYELAKIWNRYYETTPVRQAEDKALAARVWLVRQMQKIFVHGLSLLGIEVPSRM